VLDQEHQTTAPAVPSPARSETGEGVLSTEKSLSASFNSHNTFMRFRLLLVRLIAVFAMVVCAGQLADQLTQAGAFCDFGDTCEQVTSSVYGKPLGIPLPVFGLVGFGSLFAFTLVPKQWAVQLVRVLALIGAAVGIGLLVIQFAVLHNVCTLCFIVDTTAIILAMVATISRLEPPALSKLRLVGWVMAASIVVFIPICWTAAMISDTAPEEVQKHWEKGKINIVEVTDFECQHCQKADAALQQVLNRHRNIHLVRLVAPMQSHLHGKDAARAFIAARKQGKGEEMANLLYHSDRADDRTPEKCRGFAEKIGLDLNEYDQTISNDSTAVEINKTHDWATKTVKLGVPFMWIQHEFIKGTPSPEDLEEAIRNAKPAVK
jgi:uncharacterized membrane protein/predicted DsbA family dithiol-disulfide isomerase